MDDDYDDEYTYHGIGSSRFHYSRHSDHPTPDDEMSSDASVSSNDSSPLEFRPSQKLKDKSDQIYGVFGESDSDDKHEHRKRIKTKDWCIDKKNLDLGSMFVKSQTEDVKMNLEDHDQEDNMKQDEVDKDKDLIEEENERRKYQQEANAKFNMLLERGKRKRPSSNVSLVMERKHNQNSEFQEDNGINHYDSMDHVEGMGLGFNHTRHATVDNKQITDKNDDMDSDIGFSKGLVYRNSKTDVIEEIPSGDTPTLSSFISSSSKMSNFVGASIDKKATYTAPIKKDPNLGQWEKHTKGIGMRLLAKMGYKGSGGLGAIRLKKKPSLNIIEDINKEVETEHRPGISRPVEVVVRPQNLGLGYGSFKEATKLKVNQRIEAEVRGVDWEKKEAEERKKKNLEEEERLRKSFGVQKSIFPTTGSLVAMSNWRKGGRSKKNMKKDIQVLSYQDILKGQKIDSTKEKVIDMRGPDFSLDSTTARDRDNRVMLGEELLHNVTFLLNTYENKLHSSSHFARSSRSKYNSLKEETTKLEERKTVIMERRLKLQKVLSVIEGIESVHTQKVDISSRAEIFKIQSSIKTLGELFSAEEKSSLKYFTVLLPSLVSPIVEQSILRWDPLSTSTDESKKLLSTIIDMFCSMSSDDSYESSISFVKVVLMGTLLPHIQKAYQSSKWNVITHSDIGLELYEVLHDVISNIGLPKPELSPDVDGSVFGGLSYIDTSNELLTLLKDRIIFDVVYPKISRSLSQSNQSDKQTLHSWLLPWLPHLDYRSMLVSLIPDIKRKLKVEVSKFCKVQETTLDRYLFETIKAMLKPWIKILSHSTIQGIMTECVSPLLGRALSQENISDCADEQSWDVFDVIFSYFNDGILSTIEFLSLVEGEVLLPMACKLFELIAAKKIDTKGAGDFYSKWRRYMTSETKYGARYIKKDTMICRIFYGCLLMIKTMSENQIIDLDMLEPLGRQFINYKLVQSRRAKEERLQEEEMALKGKVGDANKSMKSHVSLHGRGGATFREVVEDFANHHGKTFHHKLGSNSSMDGKPIYIFGNSQIYLDSNVIFVLMNGVWEPISLSELINVS